MKPFEHLQKLQATAEAISSFNSPIAKFMKQQQEIQEQFRVVLGNHSTIFRQASVVAKLPAFSALEGLDSLLNISRTAAALNYKPVDLGTFRHAVKSMNFQQKTFTASLKELGSLSLLGMNDPTLKATRLFREISQLGILPKIAAIPPSTMLDIKAIVAHQEKFDVLAVNISKGIFTTDLSAFRAQGLFHPDIFQSQLKTLSLALKRQGEQFTTAAILAENWNAIEDFERVHNETLEVGEFITIDNNVSEAEQIRIEDLIETLKNFFVKYKSHFTGTKTTLELLSLIISIYAFFVDPKAGNVSKEDIVVVESKLDSLKQLLKKEIVFVANRKCIVFLKPKLRSYKTGKLDCGAEVTIIEIHRKWAYISFQSTEDNFYQTGWVLKKYLQLKK